MKKSALDPATTAEIVDNTAENVPISSDSGFPTPPNTVLNLSDVSVYEDASNVEYSECDVVLELQPRDPENFSEMKTPCNLFSSSAGLSRTAENVPISSDSGFPTPPNTVLNLSDVSVYEDASNVEYSECDLVLELQPRDPENFSEMKTPCNLLSSSTKKELNRSSVLIGQRLAKAKHRKMMYNDPTVQRLTKVFKDASNAEYSEEEENEVNPENISEIKKSKHRTSATSNAEHSEGEIINKEEEGEVSPENLSEMKTPCNLPSGSVKKQLDRSSVLIGQRLARYKHKKIIYKYPAAQHSTRVSKETSNAEYCEGDLVFHLKCREEEIAKEEEEDEVNPDNLSEMETPCNLPSGSVKKQLDKSSVLIGQRLAKSKLRKIIYDDPIVQPLAKVAEETSITEYSEGGLGFHLQCREGEITTEEEEDPENLSVMKTSCNLPSTGPQNRKGRSSVLLGQRLARSMDKKAPAVQHLTRVLSLPDEPDNDGLEAVQNALASQHLEDVSVSEDASNAEYPEGGLAFYFQDEENPENLSEMTTPCNLPSTSTQNQADRSSVLIGQRLAKTIDRRVIYGDVTRVLSLPDESDNDD